MFLSFVCLPFRAFGFKQKILIIFPVLQSTFDSFGSFVGKSETIYC